MKTLLIGNGINIQYGGESFSNKAILKRVITSPEDPDFPLEATTLTDRMQSLWLIGTLFGMIPDVVNGKLDKHFLASFEQDALKSFKTRYSKFAQNPSPLYVGMEDYFFLLEMFFKEHSVVNPNAHAIRESLKRVFAYAVYNKGKLESLYHNYPPNLKAFFDQFDSIFTTNYDSNLESFTQRNIGHLHGCFKTLSYVYDERSFRNQLRDNPMGSILFDPEHPYLFSTAIFSYSGSLKEFIMGQAAKTNEALEKLAEGYKGSESVSDEVKDWLEDENDLVRNLAESVMLKCDDPSLSFDEHYPVKDFESITGSVSIVGLSPNNDTHIFNLIKQNNNISEITYYYHSLGECSAIKELLECEHLSCIDVHDLWSEYE